MNNEIQIEGRVKKGEELVWFVGCAAITGLAIFLRFFWLGLKPLHHDEGVNAWFLTNLFREGVYRYDPSNYHGPTLYYISLAFAKIFGLETAPLRWSVAVWGVLIVVLAFFLKRYVGRVGALAGAGFLALSPGMVFISRYFIHEIFFVFLSLAIVLSVLFFIERQKAGPFAIGWTALLLLVCFFPSTLRIASRLAGEGDAGAALFPYYAAAFLVVESVLVFFVVRMLLVWREGRPIYVLLAAASTALFFATKETAFITLGTMLIAILCVSAWRRVFRTRVLNSSDDIDDGCLSVKNFREALGRGPDMWLTVVAAAAVFVYVFVLFFSSFFTYPEGVQKAFEAYDIWTKTGSRDHADNGYFAYLKWAWAAEAPIVVLSAAGTAIAFVKARHRFAMFTGLWTLGLFLAYTLIPYKTPWLALSFMLPACIAAGYAIGETAKFRGSFGRFAAAGAAAVAFVLLAQTSYQLNFVRYDDETMPYVYAHTRRGFLELVADIERFSAASEKGNDAAVEVVSPDYWPLVWYLRDHPKAIFHGKLIDTRESEMIVMKKREQDQEAIRRYSANYRIHAAYPLRPGVDLVLLVRRDLAGSDAKELYRIAEY